MRDYVKAEASDGVATVTFDRPPMNMIDRQSILELGEALQMLGHDDSVKCVILVGGRMTPPFGADPAVFLSLKSWDDVVTLADVGHRTLWEIEAMPKPVIAALHDGACLGGAFELALACHMRVVGSNLQFSHPETAVSMMPGWGNTQRLTRIVGPAKAAEIILTGAPVSADEALRLGLVNHVVSNDQVLPRAQKLARAVADKRSVSIAATLAAIRHQWAPGLREGFSEELTQFRRTYDPELLRAGLSAFLEGHPVKWANK